MTETTDHREWAFMCVGWELMDLRQDIEFYHLFMADEYPAEQIIARLGALQAEVGDYADKHFPVIEKEL